MVGRRQDIVGWRRRRWRIALWITPVFILMIPAVAMRFTDEVDWEPLDFLAMGGLLLGVCAVFDLAVRATASVAYRAAVAVALATAFLVIWIDLAVGIIGHGSGYDPANLIYGAVLPVGFAGSFIARFRPEGMARAMLLTAFAQAAVAAIALILGSIEAFVLTIFFVALWLVSAWLFRLAANTQAHMGPAP